MCKPMIIRATKYNLSRKRVSPCGLRPDMIELVLYGTGAGISAVVADAARAELVS